MGAVAFVAATVNTQQRQAVLQKRSSMPPRIAFCDCKVSERRGAPVFRADRRETPPAGRTTPARVYKCAIAHAMVQSAAVCFPAFAAPAAPPPGSAPEGLGERLKLFIGQIDCVR
jgi:hypothetical protein